MNLCDWSSDVCSSDLPYLPPEKSVCRSRATVRTGHETTDWFKTGKGVCQGCILSSCLFKLNIEYIMQNARLEEAQAGIKIARRNINNLRYADDTTLIAESEEELKSLSRNVKEGSEKAGLKLNIEKAKSWHPVPLLYGKQKGEKWKEQQIFSSWAPKSLQIATVAMKQEDTYFLE